MFTVYTTPRWYARGILRHEVIRVDDKTGRRTLVTVCRNYASARRFATREVNRLNRQFSEQ